MANFEHPQPEQLLTLVRGGDDEARGRLLELYRPYLTLLAQLQIGEKVQSKLDASDIVQETFLDAHRELAAFRGTTERELMAWLRKILAGNLADKVHRRYGAQRRDVRLERSLHQQLDRSSQVLNRELPPAITTTTPSQVASRREQAALLAEALQKLPPDYRDVLVLRHLKGLTLREVAARMDRTVDSVKKLWIRAVPQFRRILGETL